MSVNARAPLALQATCVAIGGHGVLIKGAPGTGKSSLALALMDRGAVLVGDDSLLVEVAGGRLVANPHPNTHGLLEVRNLGILPFPCTTQVPVSLAVVLDADAPRFIEEPQPLTLCGVTIPLLALYPQSPVLHLKTELALARHGIGNCGVAGAGLSQ